MMQQQTVLVNELTTTERSELILEEEEKFSTEWDTIYKSTKGFIINEFPRLILYTVGLFFIGLHMKSLYNDPYRLYFERTEKNAFLFRKGIVTGVFILLASYVVFFMHSITKKLVDLKTKKDKTVALINRVALSLVGVLIYGGLGFLYVRLMEHKYIGCLMSFIYFTTFCIVLQSICSIATSIYRRITGIKSIPTKGEKAIGDPDSNFFFLVYSLFVGSIMLLFFTVSTILCGDIVYYIVKDLNGHPVPHTIINGRYLLLGDVNVS
ncbi:hypothetical protein NEMIN01_0158 [Nematocida minor]|uniref:uncharacterized protein n=1 Tax=Nematocida minor TaxID=1912983 RepID=UPI00221F9AA8|nr:uncharacterized protein NEMIN01_0054 [Nematocida minor]XP_051332060.1 uncharacterized protein NEMIN01_0158 [Nematocida minor]KAI5188790.1 hypothetical protein NEMIN01_0054 [Nematocida minor]KAI5188894.1 hypothetical protein NEMIN01_0158 [Nematocida minor]